MTLFDDMSIFARSSREKRLCSQGKLKGEMIRTTPFGSCLVFGDMA